VIKIARKIPRRNRYWIPRLSMMNQGCNSCGEYCEECMANFSAEAEYQRPVHAWTIVNGKVVFLEDVIAASMLGRPLAFHEIVIHKDGNVANNERANLEIVTIPEMEK